MKTILKLHSNGNFETVDTQLIQGDNYSFSENLITVPSIVELPPVGYRNHFIEKTSVSGYISISNSGVIKSPDEYDVASDFINVSDWSNVTIRIWHVGMTGEFDNWTTIALYNDSKEYLSALYDASQPKVGDYITTLSFPLPDSASYMRVATSYYDLEGVGVKVSVENGGTASPKHYLAPEDMPIWVRDTGQPISIFEEGIVIKGDLIQTNS